MRWLNNIRKWRRLLGAFLAALVIILALGWMILPSKNAVIQNLGDSWVFQENQTGPVIGELGGVPVSIPKPYAHLVEYDGDPNWLKRRKEPPPKRTFSSKIASFGFEVRFPDMEPVTDKTWQERRKANIFTSMWMRVGIDSNSAYGSTGDTGLESRVASIQSGHWYQYEKLPNPIYGLIGYTPIGSDLSRRNRPNGADIGDKNIYFHRNDAGAVDAYIECSNMLHSAAPCSLTFLMRPMMRVRVSVSFRKGLLPHWKEIQESVTKVVLGFRVLPP